MDFTAQDFLVIVKRSWIVILICAILGGVVAYYYSQNFVTRQYSATALLIISTIDESGQNIDLDVNNGENTNRSAALDVQSGARLVKSYSVLAKSSRVMKAVIDQLDLNMTPAQLVSAIAVSEAAPDTEYFKFSAITPDGNLSKRIVDSLARVFQQEVEQVMDINNVKIVDDAIINWRPVTPKTKKNVIVGIGLGFIAALIISAARYFLDSSIRSHETIERVMPDVPVVGSIPYFDLNESQNIIRRGDSGEKERVFEAFNTVCTNLKFLDIDRHLQVLLITSSIKNEGKSTVAINLANTLAISKRKTIIIDCDLRNPTVHRAIGTDNSSGLSELITSDLTDADYLLATLTNSEYLDVITAGAKPINPVDLLSSESMGHIMKKLREDYEYIILDAPPVLLVPDAISLHRMVDAILLVIKWASTKKETFADCKKALEVVAAKPSGLILNSVKTKDGKYSGYSYYGYYYEDDAKKSNKWWRFGK